MGGHLIVGGGPAALAAIDTIRDFGDERPVTLVSDERPYSRMVLPYLMDGTVPEENVFTADEPYLEAKGVKGVFGRRVTALDPSGSATLDDKSGLDFDDALIATGSSAVRPSIPGADGPGVYNLWTLEDARAVLDRKDGEVVVIGAGFIAFTCLDAVAANASKVTVVEVEDRILPRMIDAKGAALVQAYLEAKGIEFHTATKVTAIEDHDGHKRLKIEGGGDLDADLVLAATGIRPNLDFLQGSGIATDFGILVDDRLTTSAPKVFAAGDVAQGPVVGSENKEVHAIQPTALEHGRVAGANMAGETVSYWGSLLVNIVGVAKLQIASFGDWEGKGGDVRVVLNERRPVYRKLVFDGDRLSGAVFLGRPDDVALLNDMGMAKGLIQTQAPLGEWRRYLDRYPLDIRRPYVASRAAAKLLEYKLLGRPSSGEGFRHPDPEPRYWDHHAVFVAGAGSES